MHTLCNLLLLQFHILCCIVSEPELQELTVTQDGDYRNTATLSWKQPSGSAESYKVERKKNNGHFQLLQELPNDTLSYEVELNPNTEYHFRIVTGCKVFAESKPFHSKFLSA